MAQRNGLKSEGLPNVAESGGGGIASYVGHVPHDSALSVGSSTTKDEDARKIRDLEDEVGQLAERANSASQRFADYENEIRVLQAKLRQEQRKNLDLDTTNVPPSPALPPPETPQLSRFGSFMTRKPGPLPPANGMPQSPGEREKELEQKLVSEQTLRIAAEQKTKEVNAELEDLSTTLFQQANEMVATERKENAKLRQRIEALEKQRSIAHESEMAQKENQKLKEKIQTLEQREVERKRRFERLEAANRRIERVRTMLLPR